MMDMQSIFDLLEQRPMLLPSPIPAHPSQTTLNARDAMHRSIHRLRCIGTWVKPKLDSGK
jgi:hypothetical protein